jgi:[ribosomal protein S5]-alanine N-acetyltransferase
MVGLIRTPRLLLRPLCLDDRAEFVHVHTVSRALFAPWFPVRPADETLDDFFTRQLNQTLDGLRDGTQYRFVGLLADTRIAGFFNLFQIVRGAAQYAMASWSVSAELGRQGLCTEGVTALLDFAFAPLPVGLGLHRVQANIIPTNTPSIRVAEKAGFRREGLAKRYLKIADEWQDHFMYTKLADDHTFTILQPS